MGCTDLPTKKLNPFVFADTLLVWGELGGGPGGLSVERPQTSSMLQCLTWGPQEGKGPEIPEQQGSQQQQLMQYTQFHY